MPELPEVETTRRKLAPLIEARTVSRVETTALSYFFLTPPRVLRQRLPGRTFRQLERRGKYLLAHLEDAGGLLLHLGMTGQLFGGGATSARLLIGKQRTAEPATFFPDRHTHLCIHFDDGGPAVFFRDVRKFGKCGLLEARACVRRLEALGPDALDADPEEFWQATRTRSAPIKSVLLDQSVLAGVGNIYADEALFGARIRPTRRARSLSFEESRRLLRCVRDVLRRAIESGGTSLDDFVHPDGEDGAFQHRTRVYGRTGLGCKRCGTLIERRVLNQRGSHYCPKCQR